MAPVQLVEEAQLVIFENSDTDDYHKYPSIETWLEANDLVDKVDRVRWTKGKQYVIILHDDVWDANYAIDLTRAATATKLRWKLVVTKTYKLKTFEGESYE